MRSSRRLARRSPNARPREGPARRDAAIRLAEFLPGHQVKTVKQAGYAGLANGELIRRAISDGYEVLVTADRGIPAQQNVAAAEIAVVLVPGSRLDELRPLVAEIDRAIREASPGTIVRVRRAGRH